MMPKVAAVGTCRFITFLVLALLLAGCGGAPGATLSNGGIVFGDGERLWLVSQEGTTPAKPREVLNVSKKGSVADPAWSPNRAELAYSFTPVPGPGATFGSDLYLLPAVGGASRAIFTHDVDGGLARAPAWTPDGKALYFSYSFSRQAPGKSSPEVVQQIERLEIATGARQVIVPGGDLPTVSPDGSRLAYVRLPSPPPPGTTPARPPAPSLWLAAADGSDARPLVNDPRFTMVWGSRFSPDGRLIVFSAAGGEDVSPRLRLSRPRSNAGGWPPRVAAHGYPLDLWLVEVATGKLERLAAIGADDLYPVWSPDGQRLALQSADGLFLLDLSAGTVAPASNVPGFGGIDWR